MSVLDEVIIVDLSHHNGAVNFDVLKFKAQGAIFKATDGETWIDPTFHARKAEVMEKNLVWGSYHFFQFHQDGRKQARHFAAQIGEVLPTGHYKLHTPLNPVLDAETKPWWVSSTAALEKVRDFRSEFYSITGVFPDIYTRASWWDSAVARSAIANNCKLWVAHYGTNLIAPRIPLDWKNAVPQWRMWQWSADGNDRGKEFGLVGGSIDLNRYNGGLAALQADYPNLDIRPLGEVSTVKLPPPPAVYLQVQQLTVVPDDLRVRDNIIPSVKYGATPGMVYNPSTPLFTLPVGSKVEALETIVDGHNTWVRVGQRQYMAQVYDDNTYLI